MKIEIVPERRELGRRAAAAGAAAIREALEERGRAAAVMATGTSQLAMLDALVKTGIDFGAVTFFHLDEYIGLPGTHPASFRRYLRERFVERLPRPPAAFHFIDGGAPDPAAECGRLKGLITEHAVDVAFAGIGENGHLAFNDPPADFETKEPFIVVDLDTACRRQQLGEGWFERIEEVPRKAISMSIRWIMKARTIVCTVPEARKARAVRAAFAGPVTADVPASILQSHPRCRVFLDPDSAAGLGEEERRSMP